MKQVHFCISSICHFLAALTRLKPGSRVEHGRLRDFVKRGKKTAAKPLPLAEGSDVESTHHTTTSSGNDPRRVPLGPKDGSTVESSMTATSSLAQTAEKRHPLRRTVSNMEEILPYLRSHESATQSRTLDHGIHPGEPRLKKPVFKVNDFGRRESTPLSHSSDERAYMPHLMKRSTSNSKPLPRPLDGYRSQLDVIYEDGTSDLRLAIPDELSRKAIEITKTFNIQQKPIGHGNYGQVYLARKKASPSDYVVIKRAISGKGDQGDLIGTVEADPYNELPILAKLGNQHPNIIKMIGISVESIQKKIKARIKRMWTVVKPRSAGEETGPVVKGERQHKAFDTGRGPESTDVPLRKRKIKIALRSTVQDDALTPTTDASTSDKVASRVDGLESSSSSQLEAPHDMASSFGLRLRDYRSPDLIFEYIRGGTLANWIDMNRLNFPLLVIQSPELKRIFRGLLSALVYLESKHVLHRDIKPDNVLLRGDRTAVLADFGSAIDLDNRGAERYGLVKRVYATWYRAPEIYIQAEKIRKMRSRKGSVSLGLSAPVLPSRIEPHVHYGYPAEIWATGIILLEIMAGPTFFLTADMSEARVFSAIKEHLEWSIDAENRVTLSLFLLQLKGRVNNDDAFLLLLGMLTWDPNQRGTAKQLLKSPYLKAK